jgi:putative heme-binding domain-containing protein
MKGPTKGEIAPPIKFLVFLGLSIFALFAFSAVNSAAPPAVDDQTAVQVEALKRLKDVDLESNAPVKNALQRVLEKTRSTPQFVELVREFKLKGHAQELLDYALKYPGDSSATEAFRLALNELGPPKIEQMIAGQNGPAVVRLIGNSNDRQLQPILHNLVRDTSKPPPVRKEAVQALARSREGARFLLDLAKEDQLPADVKLAAASALNLAPWPNVKKSAAELLPLPQSKNAEPLPPISELLKRTGDPKHGQEIFESQTAACSTCHQVNGKGAEIGPNLSEIGTKLGKDALYESILDPSAGIAFGYEGWSIELKNGDEAFGLITSETGDEITVKTQTGIVSKYKKSEIAKRQKMATSIMPTGLQLTMSAQDLVDLVTYLSSLKKAN